MSTLIVLLALIGLVGIVQLVLTWYMLNELGDIDKNRSDWWERLADHWEAAAKLKEAIRRIEGKETKK